MGVEIERRFLIPESALAALRKVLPDRGDMIEQGYLARKPVVRIRHILGKKYGYITVKGKGGLSRPEYEYKIPSRDAVELLKLANFKLSKFRYKVVYQGKNWVVDQFIGKLQDFWMAEIELSKKTEKVRLPKWVSKEVTENPEYSNASLAEHGLPSFGRALNKSIKAYVPPVKQPQDDPRQYYVPDDDCA